MSMKKFAFSLLALAGILSVSCNKEQEAPVAPSVTPGKHQVTVKATIAPGTRTSYTDDKTFAWVEGDVVYFMVLSADETQISLEEFTAESSGTETYFIGELAEGETLYGLAFYTAKESYMAFGGEDDNNLYMNFPSFIRIDGDSEKYYTVDSANPLENLPLAGYKLDDGSFVFWTAGGAAKFSFEDLPEGSAYFVLENSSNALSGMFAMDEEGVFTMEGARLGTYEYEDEEYSWSSSYVGYQFAPGTESTATVYVPLPVGEIPAGTMVNIYDEEFNLLYSRPLRSAIPVERNRVSVVAPFSATYAWEDLGTGVYFDLATFYYMDNEDMTFAPVEYYKDANMPGVYRIENPYPVAAEQRGYTIPEQYTLPEHVSFTVLKDNTVVYDLIHTGFNEADNIETGTGDWFLASPAMMDEDNSYNFVAKYHEDGTPDLVILSPYYLYEYNGGYYYSLGRDLGQVSWKYMWVNLYFPGADLENQYDLSCDVTLDEIVDDDPAQPIASVTLELGESYAGVDMVIATDKEAAEELLAAGLGTHATESETYRVNFPADAPNGVYYVFAKTVPAEGFTENCALMFDSGDGYEYFRTDEDRNLQMEDIVGTYTTVDDYVTVVNGSAAWTTDATLTMVVDENEDPLSGYEIAFTDFCPELAKAIAGSDGVVRAMPLNATFDMAHGIVTIPADQTAYTIKSRSGSRTLTISAEYVGQDIQLFLRAPGVLELKTWVFLVEGNEAVGALDYELPMVYTRTDAVNAPARGPRHSSYNPFRTPLERHLGLLRNMQKPRTERAPFTGNWTKLR